MIIECTEVSVKTSVIDIDALAVNLFDEQRHERTRSTTQNNCLSQTAGE